jgi:quercetin dioxygenase-like cupin family protein
MKTTILYSTHSKPVDFAKDLALHEAFASAPPAPLSNKSGAIFCVVDLPPQGPSFRPFMHRGECIEYVAVISGTAEAWLEGNDGKGEIKMLKPGDVVVQRGTMHAWRNPGDEWCRVAVWLLPALPVQVGDVVLTQNLTGAASGKLDVEKTAEPESSHGKLDANGLTQFYKFIGTHNAEGKSTFDASSGLATGGAPLPYLKIYLIHSTHTHPVDLSSDLKLHEAMASSPPVPIVNKDGAVFRILDMAPPSKGGQVFVHRTESIDLAAVISGTVEAWLEGEDGVGEKRTMKQGDVIVLRGAMHGWRVVGDEWCRMAVVQLPAEPFQVGSEKLSDDMSGATLAKWKL